MGTVKTDSFNTTYSYEAYPVGSLRQESADEVVAAEHTDGTALGLEGDRTWMFVKTGEAIGIYDCVVHNAIATPKVVKKCAADGVKDYTVVGIAQNAIASGYYGWVVVKGECVVDVAAGITAGQYLDTDGGTTAGDLNDSTTAETLLATAKTATDSPVTGTVACLLWGNKGW